MSRWVVVLLVMLAAGIAGSLPLRVPSAARDTSEEIVVRLAEDGGVSLWVGPDSHHLLRVELTSSRFGDGRSETTRATIDALQPVVSELAASIEREPDGMSRMRMRIETAPRARFAWLEWLIQIGAHPRAQIPEYVLSSRGRSESLTWRLQTDLDWQRRPLYSDLYVSLEPPATSRPGHMALRVERLPQRGPRRGPFGPRRLAEPPPPPAPVTLECRVDEDGTPTPLQPLVAEVRRLRALERERDELWLQLTYPRGEAGGSLPARTLLDLFGALQQVDGVQVEIGTDFSLEWHRRAVGGEER